MQKNNQWFSIIIAVGLVLLISLSSFVLLDSIIPFSKNTKWIEQSTSAYYFAGSGIEEALFRIKTRSWASLMTEYSTWFIATSSTGVAFQTFSAGNTIPPAGYGNSEIDKNFNQLSATEQIQLEVGRDWVNPLSLSFQARVPAFTWWTLALSWTTQALIFWSLTSENNTLNASGSTWWFSVGNIPPSTSPSTSIVLWTRTWLDLSGSGRTFWDFYNNECWVGSGCILKMSLVRELLLTNGNRIPYLEYQINAGWTVPQRYTRIQASGKAYGFKKDLEVNIPQTTLNQAFDFTVFQ